MRKLLVIGYWLLVATQAQGALTLIQRETFQAVGTLSSGTPGNLGTVTGSFYKRAVGPRLTSDTTANSLGWSADLHQVSTSVVNVNHQVAITATAAATIGCFSSFYYIDSFANNGANLSYLQDSRVANTNQFIQILLDSATGNFWYNRNGLWTDTNSTVAVPLKQWFELRLSWQNTSGTTYNMSVDYRLAGSSSWVAIYSATGVNTSSALASVKGGQPSASNSYGVFRGRYGMPSLYQMAAYADRTILVSDVTDPSSGGHTWYVNPSTGSDTNDGTDSTHAWQTVGQVNTESTYCGMFPATTYAAGDTLYIDTTAANLVLGTSSLNVNTRGLNLVQLGGGLTGPGEIQAWVAIVAGDWSGPIASTTKVYQATLSEANTSAVLWEDDKWLTHVAGANLAAVRATLESTAGSFWTDGTTMYVHPLGNTNPASDGKTYTRSYYRATVSAVQLLASDVHVSGLRVRKTCVADKATNDPGVNYCLQGQSGFGGTSLIENCYLDYGSKHILGFTDNNSSSRVTISNVQVEQGSPYASQNPFVSYNGGGSTLDNQHYYVSCTNSKTDGLLGSTAGTNLLTSSFYSHNGSGSNQFSLISFSSCNFGGAITSANSVLALTVDNTVYGGGPVGSTTYTVNRSRATQQMPYMSNASGAMIMRNSIVVPTFVWGAGLNLTHDLNGTETIEGCTFDLTQTEVTANDGGGLFKHSTNATLTFRDNVVILPNDSGFSVFESLTTGDTITATNNAYYAPANIIAYSYNDGSTTANRTFAQWQALGKDANSVSVTDLVLDTLYKPRRGSPVINTGVDLGPLVDYTNRLFGVRNDIGAYEFYPSAASTLRHGGRRF